ncbi:HAMP domain-containing sensor histidine kinase [Bacillus sp. FSL K6-0042]|nr:MULTISPECIES: HAMP domain-containing sensor histidine kinase [Bacillus cereus group]MDF2084328.1 HAMP domain-containing sensor histidine kinase [Bacillus pseudomycoides]PEK58443.1 sensor histidine kinase [Bacillus pseudomycoides]PEL22231.1 sensor histidine kinase [Bacillus pseudomycoides]PGE81168.1 sensor histidine kinase [Bacillus pseudomycoides]
MKNIFRPIGWMNRTLKKIIYKVIRGVQKSLRVQLITTFAFCILLGVIGVWTSSPFFQGINTYSVIDYSSGMRRIDATAERLAEVITREGADVNVQEVFERPEYQGELKVLIVDENGKVIYKTKDAQEEQVNLHSTIRNIMSFKINRSQYEYQKNVIDNEIERERKEFTTFYPLTIQEKNMYMIASGIPQGDIRVVQNDGPFPFLIGFVIFLFSFFYITKRKMRQVEAMAEGVKEIAKGNLQYRIPQKGQDELSLLAVNMNQMAKELFSNIEKERKIEKQKNELITNVSHDLRTPLTSIMGYLRLLQDSKYESKEQHNEYVRIAFSKSEQLKNLIEDLFEYTKLTNEKMVLEKQEVCITELLEQLIEELVPQAEEEGLILVKQFPKERVYAAIDSEKMVRVFENLLMNAIKYSKDDGEIKVSLQRQRRNIQITVANHSEEFTKEELGNLFERFYKKDQSRSRVTEGSGLGLAIAKSIVELQGGEIRAEYEDGIIQFIVSLPIIEEK